MSQILFGVFFLAPVLLLIWQGTKNLKPFQFGLPVLMALPVAAIPMMVALDYVLNVDSQYRHIVWYFYILAIIYQVGYGFNFWATGDRSRWNPAFNILSGVIIGPCALVVWVYLVIKACDLLGISLQWVLWI